MLRVALSNCVEAIAILWRFVSLNDSPIETNGIREKKSYGLCFRSATVNAFTENCLKKSTERNNVGEDLRTLSFVMKNILFFSVFFDLLDQNKFY